jgi:hypothetical protein
VTRRILLSLLWLALLALPRPAAAQVTPAAGATPPDDTQRVSVGAVIYYDYTYQTTPKVKDAAGNDVTFSTFQVTRAYINITGQLSHVVSFRITPDVARLTDGSLNGSQVFRIKYAFGQFNFDQWTGSWKSSWARLGVQQTPYVDFAEGIYRYRFQGTTFAERVSSMSSSDAGGSFHSNLPNNYGDFHVGFYNGENYNNAEVNNVKGFEVRGTLRPMGRGSVNARGLRLTGFWINDAPVSNGRRDRALFNTTYEHKHFTASYEYLNRNDQTLPTSADVHAAGWSIWVTPFFKEKNHGPEVLIRYDDYKPDTNKDALQKRTIVGFSWWFAHPGGNATAALLFDYDGLTGSGSQNTLINNKKWALHGLINF